MSQQTKETKNSKEEVKGETTKNHKSQSTKSTKSTRNDKYQSTQSVFPKEDLIDKKITLIWRDNLLRKIFLDIIGNSQFRLCKYIKKDFFKKISALIKNGSTDNEIYDEMHDCVHKHLKEKTRKSPVPPQRQWQETQKKLGKNGELLSTIEKFEKQSIDVPDNFEIVKITNTPYTNGQFIQYAPKKEEVEISEIDFEAIIKKYITPYHFKPKK